MSESVSGNLRRLNRKSLATSVFSDLAKLPPQAIEIEEVVLGALMLEKDAISIVLDILESDSFYKEEHKEIYSAIRRLFEKSQPIDILTVTNELRLENKLELAGGAFYISELTNRVSSAANIEYHSRIVAQKYIMRKLIEVSSHIQRDAYEETTDVFELLDQAERELFGITEKNLRSSYADMGVLISKAIKQIEEVSKNANQFSGVPSGYVALDRHTSGFQNSDLIIIAARPGMGKTAFAMSIARNAAVDHKIPVAVFSLEMSSLQLVLRLMSSEAEIDSMKLKNGSLADHEWTMLNTRITKISSAPIYIDDTPALNVFELRAKCRRMKAQYGIGLVVIDYLQLMAGNKDGKQSMNREQEISTISRSLKGLAKELNIPVIALSQLSRQVEQRGGTKKPILSDLRESGSIEQDADQVMFIYRPEYYDLTQDEEGRPTAGVAEIIIAKNRHGATETVNLRYIARFARFGDLDDFGNISSEQPASFSPGPNFKSITKGSRMNDDNIDDEVPF